MGSFGGIPISDQQQQQAEPQTSAGSFGEKPKLKTRKSATLTGREPNNPPGPSVSGFLSSPYGHMIEAAGAVEMAAPTAIALKGGVRAAAPHAIKVIRGLAAAAIAGETVSSGLKAIGVNGTLANIGGLLAGAGAAGTLEEVLGKETLDKLAAKAWEEKYGVAPKTAGEKLRARGEALKIVREAGASPKAAKAEKQPPIRENIERELYEERRGKKPETARERVQAIREYNKALRSGGKKPLTAKGETKPAAGETPDAAGETKPPPATPVDTGTPSAAGSSKPTVRLRAKTGTAPEPHAAGVSTERSEQDIGRFASNLARDRNAQIGNILKSKGFTADQVAGMSEDEFYKAVGSTDPATSKPIQKFRGKLDPKTGKAATQHRTFEQGRNDIVAWLKEQG